MVECQGGQFVKWKPSGFGCVVTAFYLCQGHLYQIGNGDGSSARVTVYGAETFQFLYFPYG